MATYLQSLHLCALSDSSKVLEQREHVHPETIRNHLDGIERWIGLPGFNPAQIGLVEAAALRELDLGKSSLETQRSHAFSESLCQVAAHNGDCQCYASIHIHTNSYTSLLIADP